MIYYSLSGNTRFVAETIAKTVGADILELKPKLDLSKRGFMKYAWGGRQVIMKYKPELLDFDKDINDYDILFIGTPVWAFSFAPALRSFFAKIKIVNKKIAIFCCHGGIMGKTLENMKKYLSGNEILGEIDFKEPLKFNRDEARVKAENWVRELLDAGKLKACTQFSYGKLKA